MKITTVVNNNFFNVDHKDTFFANYSKFQVYKTVYIVKAISPFTPIILRRLLTLEPRLQQRGVGPGQTGLVVWRGSFYVGLAGSSGVRMPSGSCSLIGPVLSRLRLIQGALDPYIRQGDTAIYENSLKAGSTG